MQVVLVLLPKAVKPPGDPSVYHPICMLDTTGKLSECKIINRLLAAIEVGGGLSGMQFRAVMLVKQLAKEAINGKRSNGGSKKYYLIIILLPNYYSRHKKWQEVLQALN